MALQIFIQSNCFGETPRTSWRRAHAAKIGFDTGQDKKKGRNQRSPSILPKTSHAPRHQVQGIPVAHRGAHEILASKHNGSRHADD